MMCDLENKIFETYYLRVLHDKVFSMHNHDCKSKIIYNNLEEFLTDNNLK